MAKPMLSDEKHTQIYTNGSYAVSSSPGRSVDFEMGILNIHRSHTYKSINLSYGIFGYLGNAKFISSKTEANPNDGGYPNNFRKSISGLGLRTSIGYQIASDNGNVNFRLINWENSLSTEAGNYADFRKQIYRSGIYSDSHVSDKMTLWTTGLSTEIIWHGKKSNDVQHAFRIFAGGTPGLVKSFDGNLNYSVFGTDNTNDRIEGSIARSFSYYLKVKHFSFCYELSADVNWANKLSLGYSF